MVAEVGLEPHDLRVMSPTSYHLLHPAIFSCMRVSQHGFTDWCRKPGSNRYDTHVSRDFKSRASANSAIPASRARAISRFLKHKLCFCFVLSSVPVYYNRLFLVCQAFFEKNFKKFLTKNDRPWYIACFCLKASVAGKKCRKKKGNYKKTLEIIIKMWYNGG